MDIDESGRVTKRLVSPASPRVGFRRIQGAPHSLWRDMAGGADVGILLGPKPAAGIPIIWGRGARIRAAAAHLRCTDAEAPRCRMFPSQCARRAASRWEIAGGATPPPITSSIICMNNGRATRTPNFSVAFSGRHQRRAQGYIARYAETKKTEARDAPTAKANSPTRQKERWGAT